MAVLAFVCAVMDMVRTQNRLLVGERFYPDLGRFSVPVADVCMITINNNSPAMPGCCRFNVRMDVVLIVYFSAAAFAAAAAFALTFDISSIRKSRNTAMRFE